MKQADQSYAIRHAYETYREVLSEFAPPPWEEMNPLQRVAFEAACAVIFRAADLGDQASGVHMLDPESREGMTAGVVRTVEGELRKMLAGERKLEAFSISRELDEHAQPTGTLRFEFETDDFGDTEV